MWIKCTAGNASNANYTLNADIPITMINADDTSESLNFNKINFIIWIWEIVSFLLVFVLQL